MFIPIGVVKKQNFKKAVQNTQGKRIFKDKAVSAKRSPFLYNIEIGHEYLQSVAHGPFSPASSSKVKQGMPRSPTSGDRGYLARELLSDLGVMIDPVRKKSHSLVAEEASKLSLLANPNLIDWDAINNAKVQSVSTEYAFKDSNDPFYAHTLDQLNEYSPREKYVKESDPHGKPAYIPDTSKLASSLVQLNLSNISFGKTKYFHNPVNYKKIF